MKIKKHKHIIYSYLILIVLQFSTYYLTQIINKDRMMYDLTIKWFDDKIPFIPFFVIFYVMAYALWAITPFLLRNIEIHKYNKWFLAVIIMYLITFITYIIIPTTIQRPLIEGDSFFEYCVNLIYLSDSPEKPTNLFPSMHCWLSVMCYLGLRNIKLENSNKANILFKTMILVLVILICLSTQFIKQHYIVDLISGVILPIIVYIVVNRVKGDLSNDY